MLHNTISVTENQFAFFTKSNKNLHKSSLISMCDEFLLENKKYYLYTASQRIKYLTHFINGKLYKSNGKLLRDKTLIYVLDKDNNLYTTSLKPDFHHSFFVAGQPVKAAGMIATNFIGEIAMISNESGHYTPTSQEMLAGLSYLIEYMSASESFDSIEYEAHDNIPHDGKVYVFDLFSILKLTPESTIDHIKNEAIRSFNGRKSNPENNIQKSNHQTINGYDDTIYDCNNNMTKPAIVISRYGLQLKRF